MAKQKTLEQFANGRVTVGKITQVVDNQMVSFFVGKLAGVIVGSLNEYRFDNAEAAKAHAREFREMCRYKLHHPQAALTKIRMRVKVDELSFEIEGT